MDAEPCIEIAYMTVDHALKALEACLRRAMLVGDDRIEYIARYCRECAAIHLSERGCE